MTPYQSSLGTVIGINARLLYAAMMSAFAWYIWPETMLGYGWGFISICLWLSSVVLFIQAVKAAIKIYHRDKVLAAYAAQGGQPKTAKLTSADALKKSEMI